MSVVNLSYIHNFTDTYTQIQRIKVIQVNMKMVDLEKIQFIQFFRPEEPPT